MVRRLFPSLRDAEERQLLFRVAGTLALPLTLVVLIPLLFGVWLVDRESKARFSQTQEQREELRRGLTITLINQCNRDANQNLKLRRAARQLGLSEKQIELLPALPRGERRQDGTWIGCGNYPPPLR